MPTPTQIFVPGFAARCDAYAAGLPEGWTPVQPPLAEGGGSVRALTSWLIGELERRPGPALVAGHSMGGALAVLAAAERPELVSGLILIAPAGLPLAKPVPACVRDFLVQLARGTHRVRHVLASALELARDPRAARRLIGELRQLDLSLELRRLRRRGMPAAVVGCPEDTLVTQEHCRRVASLLGARYREVVSASGHVWPVSTPAVLGRTLRPCVLGRRTLT